MKNYFYFNECLGENNNIHTLTSAFENIVRNFATINKNGDCHIIFEKAIREIMISGYRLDEIINGSPNKYFRTSIFSYLKNFPSKKFIEERQKIELQSQEDDIIINDYTFANQDATNLAIAYYCDWIAFSLPVSSDLKKNQLELQSSVSSSLKISNFYGENIDATNNAIRELQYKKAQGIEKIKALAKNVTLLPEFVNYFNTISLRDQQLIIDRLEYAKKEQIILSDKNKANDKVVKHVKTTVGELRILNPIDIRVYFHEIGKDTLIVASMNYKNRYKTTADQTKDIENAEKLIKKYI